MKMISAKFFLSLFTVLLIQKLAIAQSDSIKSVFNLYDKDKNIIGLSYRGGIPGLSSVATYKLRYGYFALKKLNTGFEIGYGHNADYHREYIAGPFIRYYFINRKISPVIEASYNYVYSTHLQGRTPYYKSNSHHLGVEGGLAFTGIIKRRLGIEILGEFKVKLHTQETGSIYWFFPTVRILYSF